MSDPRLIPLIHDTEWSKQLEAAYEEYLMTCEEQIDWVEGEPEPVPTLSGEAFCGCSTCYTREQLFFLIPHIIEGYLHGKIGIKIAE
jgi:hypothetical protein